MIRHEAFVGLRAWPYKLGGRTSAGVDCLGVALLISNELGNEWRDPWRAFLDKWQADDAPPLSSTGFPAHWRRVDQAPGASVQPGDVWVWHTLNDHPTVGIVRDGLIWTAAPGVGVIALASNKTTPPDEIWRP